MSRVAIFLHGGIGGGHFAQGQPPIQQLVTRLARNFDIDVYSLSAPAADYQPENFRITSVPWRGLNLAGWAYLSVKFLIAHKREPYRLVYAFWGYPAGSLAVMLGKLAGIPSVIHLQGGDAVSIPSLKYGVFYRHLSSAICRVAYARCSCLIALSEFQAECLKKNNVSGTPIVIPFGPDTSRFAFVPDRFDQPVVRFLHVGNQTPIKGQRVMLEVFSIVAKQLPCRLVLIGADYYEGELMELCTALGIDQKVEFLGPQPHEAMPRYYHEADILLHTPEFEGQGVVFAEAAACGTLIAGTDVGMLADMGDKCGLIVSSGEYRRLPGKILAILDSRDAIVEMRHNALRWVLEKDVNYCEARIAGVLNELILNDSQKRQVQTGQAQG